METFTRDPGKTSMTAESPHIELEFLALTIAQSRCWADSKRDSLR